MLCSTKPCTTGAGRTLSQFALVSYLPDPLGAYLDRLRLDLTPHCNPHAHVTVLPPRPVDSASDLSHLTNMMTEAGRLAAPFEVTLGEIDVFPVTNVIYLALAGGEKQLRDLHGMFNTDGLAFNCPFPYHPHITVAQDLSAEQSVELAETARARWKAYDGPRRFTVEWLSFVQNVAPGMWVDLARIPLAARCGVPVKEPVATLQ